MPDQGPAPLLNRAWPRRGWASPPHWGRSVPGLMAETTVLFEHRVAVLNDIGGFKGNPWSTRLSTIGHVELVEEASPVSAETGVAIGHAVERHYRIFIPMPPDPLTSAAMPQKGDRVTFSDGIVQHSVPIAHVTIHAGLLDHCEIHTEEVSA